MENPRWQRSEWPINMFVLPINGAEMRTHMRGRASKHKFKYKIQNWGSVQNTKSGFGSGMRNHLRGGPSSMLLHSYWQPAQFARSDKPTLTDAQCSWWEIFLFSFSKHLFCAKDSLSLSLFPQYILHCLKQSEDQLGPCQLSGCPVAPTTNQSRPRWTHCVTKAGRIGERGRGGQNSSCARYFETATLPPPLEFGDVLFAKVQIYLQEDVKHNYQSDQWQPYVETQDEWRQTTQDVESEQPATVVWEEEG